MTAGVRVRDVDTPQGLAQVHLHRPAGTATRGTVLVGHGAGAGVEVADLQALTALATRGWTVALLQQPWRVAGRKVATPPPTLDSATAAVLTALRHGRWRVPEPLVLAGRSAGARVACRLAVDSAAAGVVALAFPLHPPGRPERSRAAELLLPVRHGIPMLVVQGTRDPFGRPDEVRAVLQDTDGQDTDRQGTDRAPAGVVEVPGDHGPTTDLPTVLATVSSFLDGLPWGPDRTTSSTPG
jgi:predicted alpha/beta-hydrolase family hydrolase